jgi:DNA (cytosine-5)-methyltransferase 1
MANPSRGTEMLEREGYVRVKEAAAILDVAPNTVRAWGAAGKIAEYRHPANNYRLYKVSELKRINELVQPPRKAK